MVMVLYSLDMTERGLTFLFLWNKLLEHLPVCHFVSGQGIKVAAEHLKSVAMSESLSREEFKEWLPLQLIGS